MGEAYIIRRGGKETAAYAIIGVNAPVGSTVTCKKGTTSLTARGGNTDVYFYVPEVGTWRVTAAGGGKSASQDVSITKNGQVEKITLVYGLALVTDGVIQNQSAWQNTNVSISAGTGYADLRCTEQDYSMGAYVIPVDLTSYSTLTFDGFNVGDSNCDYLKVAIKQSSDASQPTTAGELIDIKAQTSRPGSPLTLDVSGKTGTWYVGIYGHGLFYSDLDIHRAIARIYDMALS